MCEKLSRLFIKDKLLCEPVANTHHKGSFHLTYVNHWVQATKSMNEAKYMFEAVERQKLKEHIYLCPQS